MTEEESLEATSKPGGFGGIYPAANNLQ